MNKLKINLVILFAIIIGVSFVGCEKEMLKTQKNVEEQAGAEEYFQMTDMPQFKIQKGILLFENEEDLGLALKVLSNIEYDDYLKWTENNNFISLDNIYYKIMQAENDLTEYYESLTKEEAQNIEIKQYTDLTIEYIKKELIKEEQTDDITPILTLTTSRPLLSCVLSENNFICIGDTIYQFNQENIKKIPNKDFSKITVVDNIPQILSNSSIIIENLNYLKKEHKDYCFNTPFTTIYGSKNNKKIKLRIYYEQYTYGNTDVFTTHFLAEMWYYKKVWGKWRARNTDFEFKASTFKVKSVLANGTNHILNESRNLETKRNCSYARRFYLRYAYGGNLNSYIHTPYIYSGRLYFSGAGCSISWSVNGQYGLK